MKKPITLLFALMLSTMLNANNIAVTNVSLTGQNTSAGVNNAANYAIVKFDIGWENSWRTSSAPYNWDAAWVFVKYRITEANGGDGLWKQTWLNNAGHTAPTGSVIDIGLADPSAEFNAITNPGLGAFCFREADGTGAFTKTGVKLQWNYGANGVADGAIVDIQVFAIEMAYVPQGSFYLGSGGDEGGHFYKYPATSDTYLVESEGSITMGTINGNLWGTGDEGNSSIGNEGTLAAAFPKGYAAIYCMKYEIDQQEYVDFLNSLTYTQQETRTAIAPNSVVGTFINSSLSRNKIKISTSGTNSTLPAIYATEYPYVACNFLGWADVIAYLDWSGLRPMTELEFEKACRGTLTPVEWEYAWGTPGLATSAYTLNNSGANTEVIADNYSITKGNASYIETAGSIDGPLRVGLFAGASGNTGRLTSGATYYGIMEMSGNLWEHIVTVGNDQARSFTGAHGNGVLEVNGNANVTNWPGPDAERTGLRGGDWAEQGSLLFVSSREVANCNAGDRNGLFGGRGVRSQKFYVGQSYGGGIIFYIGGTGRNGLIAATADQSNGIIWAVAAYQGISVPETSTSIGSGSANTDKIITQNGVGTTYAAGLARSYNGGGYSDWFLPSKDELNQMYLQKTVIGGFVSNLYWSSSEYNAAIALSQYIDIGFQSSAYKYTPYGVRAVRDFTTVPTVTTATISDITPSTATSGGDVTDDGGASVTARGICWSTSSNPEITGNHTTDGSGTGSFVSNLTGLSQNTLYYVRAYATNSAGTAYGNMVCFTNCGSSITISHVEGAIVPVNKTVTYGTVAGIPGEKTKCWITSNLGADHQAIAVDDATEESAGWYWQFNLKQGYKNDGSVLTPSWTITSIDENSDWQAANDPCALELGSGWRIPTQTEWTNVVASGNWVDNYRPFHSGLKLHQAGSLDENGGLNYPGALGGYMSITQSSNVYDWALYFDGGHCGIIERLKAYAHSLRCIK